MGNDRAGLDDRQSEQADQSSGADGQPSVMEQAAPWQIARWRRDFLNLTGIDPSIEIGRMEDWQRAHGLPPTGKVRRAEVEAAQAEGSREAAQQPAKSGVPQQAAPAAHLAPADQKQHVGLQQNVQQAHQQRLAAVARVEALYNGGKFTDPNKIPPPSFWRELREGAAWQLWHPIKMLGLGMVGAAKQNARHTQEIMDESRERGVPMNPVGASMAAAVTDGAAGVKGSLDEATEDLRKAVEAETAAQKALLAFEYAKHITSAALQADALVEPVVGFGEVAADVAAGGAAGASTTALAADARSASARESAGDSAGQLERSTVDADAGRTGTKPGAKNPAREPYKVEQQRAQQRIQEQVPAEPVRRSQPHKPLTTTERAELLEKREARTLTPEEYERLEWDQRLNARRKRGVSNFWREERARLKAGQPGTRAWNEEQRAAILRGDTPKSPGGRPIEGHHRWNVADYPQKAAEPGHIVPATPKEHLEKWHGGNFQNDTEGEALNPDFEDEF